jgi:hypothetical protein
MTSVRWWVMSLAVGLACGGQPDAEDGSGDACQAEEQLLPPPEPTQARSGLVDEQFFFQAGRHGVGTYPLDGGEWRVIYEGGVDEMVVVDDVYYLVTYAEPGVAGVAIERMSSPGAATKWLASFDYVGDLVPDGATLKFTSQEEDADPVLTTLMLPDGEHESVTQPEWGVLEAVRPDGELVFRGLAGIWSWRGEGPAVEVVASDGEVRDLLFVGDDLYWTEHHEGEGHDRIMLRSGGAVRILETLGATYDLAVRGRVVYWLGLNAPDNPMFLSAYDPQTEAVSRVLDLTGPVEFIATSDDLYVGGWSPARVSLCD